MPEEPGARRGRGQAGRPDPALAVADRGDTERAEDVARLLRVALPRILVDDDDDRPARAPMLALARAGIAALGLY